MNGVREQLDCLIARKRKELDGLEWNLREGYAYLRALQDAAALFDRNGQTGAVEEIWEDGSDLARVKEIIQLAGRPMHINEISPLLTSKSPNAPAVHCWQCSPATFESTRFLPRRNRVASG